MSGVEIATITIAVGDQVLTGCLVGLLASTEGHDFVLGTTGLLENKMSTSVSSTRGLISLVQYITVQYRSLARFSTLVMHSMLQISCCSLQPGLS